jgi:hypothetical protein
MTKTEKTFGMQVVDWLGVVGDFEELRAISDQIGIELQLYLQATPPAIPQGNQLLADYAKQRKKVLKRIEEVRSIHAAESANQ